MVVGKLRKPRINPWAKLSPNAGDLVSIALAAEEAGADAVVLQTRFFH